MKASRKLLAVILALVTGALVAGCGGGSASSGSSDLTLGNVGWDENVVAANLTKALLEDELGYNNVKIQQADVGPTFEGVSTGDLDAFQDVWTPNHDSYLNDPNIKDNIEQLPRWYEGTTQFGLAAPTYMRTNDGQKVTSIDQLNDTKATQILGIEPGAVITGYIDKYVIPDYGLDLTQKQSSTAAMLSEVDSEYNNADPFVFVAWRPHWMNQDYSFNYLDDPKGSLGKLDSRATVSTIVNKDLPNKHPGAYAFMKAMDLNEDQVVDVERENQAANGDALQGAKNWIKNNRDVVQPWIDAGKQAQT